MTNDVIVPTNHTLTIEADTLVLMAGVASGSAGKSIEVRGTINSAGTEDQPVTITCASSNLNWGQIRHTNAQASVYRYTTITKAGRARGEGHTGAGLVIRSWNSKITFEGCNLTDYTTATNQTLGKVMYASGSDLVISNCLLSRAVMGPEIESTGLQLLKTYVTDMAGSAVAPERTNDNDGLYLWGQQAGQTILLRDCVFARMQDDGIDTLGSMIDVENCLVRNCDNPSEDSKGISIFNGTVYLRRCLFTDNTVGVSAKTSSGNSFITINQCTVTGNLTNVLAQKKSNALLPNIDYRITNSILWGGNAVHSDHGDTNFTIVYSDVSEPWPGTGNLNQDPLFVDPANHVYRLQATSPCLDAGSPDWPLDPDGTRADMGCYLFNQPPPAPRLLVENRPPPAMAAALVTLSFLAAPSRSYTVECADALEPGAWGRLADFAAEPTARRVEFTDEPPIGVSRRYYRVRTPSLL